MTTTFTIRPTVSEEALEGWIWTNDTTIQTNGFIIIKNPINKKSIKTFRRTIDNNFQAFYNDRPHTNDINIESGETYLILNEFYRNYLDIERTGQVRLEIKKANWWHILFKVHLAHPNPTVQFANRATIISIILGFLGLLLAIYSICLTFK